ncbi:PEGA domain-containing protein [Bacteroidetes bacterium endosymbiont of Geopemphigus sp.]|uniref:PEGA domain-containing protein n=1 Tax=Bacteroidetes bacterium endosymbiont of Geopemphigus sp. TaxID=2047937 RepID=UPI000CD0E270|nr:PEGA domain-containing protein [Bacteroidetes bacterium endosymbiont of Geopemphigus sp.]
MKFSPIITIVSIAFFVSSCATLFTGTSDKISFQSEPQGAKVFVKGIERCTTPCRVSISRSLTTTKAQMSLPGYEKKIFELTRTFNGISLLNFFGFIGWGVDAATGAVMKYDIKGYNFDMNEKTN